jgi:trehalose 6-phosphate synthase/phosphatase
MGDDYVYHM